MRFISIPRRLTSKRIFDIFLALLFFLLVYGLTIYRTDQVPDLFTDEIIYTRTGIRTAGEGALVWDSGEPFLVHPPLYFLVEAAYFRMTRDPNLPLYSAGDIFTDVQSARRLNAIFAGFTASLLYLFGKRLHSRKLGVFVALVFALDPFVLRINHRAMLETFAGLLMLAGMAVFLTSGIPSSVSISRNWTPPIRLPVRLGTILSGLLLGFALLAKELTIISLVALGAFGIYELTYRLSVSRRGKETKTIIDHLLRTIFPACTAVIISLLTYSLYPFWVGLMGSWQEFSREKLLGIRRLMGLVQLTGWNRPGISLFDLLSARLADYGASFLILGLGGLATVFLLIGFRHVKPARFLGVWGGVLYPFYAFLTIAGSGNDQFFYFLLLPAIILVGYAAFLLSEVQTIRVPSLILPTIFRKRLLPGIQWVPWILLVLLLPIGAVSWWFTYADQNDNSYEVLTEFVERNIPLEEPLNATGDPTKFRYFFPDRVIEQSTTPEEAVQAGVHYFALAPKDAKFRYGKSNPEMAAWIQTEGELVFSVTGDSYGDLFLYRVDHPGIAPPASQNEPVDTRHWRSFQPAKGGDIGVLILVLFLWVVWWVCLSTLLVIVHRPRLLLLLKGSSMNVPRISLTTIIKSWFM